VRVSVGFSHNAAYLDGRLNKYRSYVEGNIIFICDGHSVAAPGRAAGRRQCRRNPITPVLCVRPAEERSLTTSLVECNSRHRWMRRRILAAGRSRKEMARK